MTNDTLIKDHTNPEIFLALKKVCQYVVDDTWKTDVMADSDVADAEYNLVLAQTKVYKDDIEKLSQLDTDLTWGCVRIKQGNGYFTRKEGDFNPWYDGNLKLKQLLDSLASLTELLDMTNPKQMQDVEYLHFYNYLYFVTIPVDSPNKSPKKSITFDALHIKIRNHCEARYKAKNYSDAVFTACKVVFQEIKDLTGSNLDGKRLAEQAFALDNPQIKLNNLNTESEKDEQKGFILLLSGLYLGIRNPQAHDLINQYDEHKTLEYLSFISLLLERIDERMVD